jgi:hypothetical protein
VRAHIKEQPQTFERFGAPWTPTQLILDADAKEHYRIEGFLPVADFAAQLEMGLAKLDFDRKQFAHAGELYQTIYNRYPDAGVAPEAMYWEGVAAYKATNIPAPLGEAAKRLQQKYPDSEWSRKASVWL